MSADPAELIFFQEMTTDKFFQQAEELGVTLEQLQDEDAHDHVFYTCLVKLRKDTAKTVSAGLGIAITDEQAEHIARHSLVPEVIVDAVPLSPDERAIARELYYHALKSAVPRHGDTITDRKARSEAKKMVRLGERGLSGLQRLSQACGCLVVLGVFTMGTALTCLAAVAAMLAVTRCL